MNTADGPNKILHGGRGAVVFVATPAEAQTVPAGCQTAAGSVPTALPGFGGRGERVLRTLRMVGVGSSGPDVALGPFY